MPDDNRMLFVGVMPAWLCRKIEGEFGNEIRRLGDMFATDLMNETEIELSDKEVKVEIQIRRKKREGDA